MSERLRALADAGVSIWLDDLSRERIETGNLADLVEKSSVVGVTTNPTIFAAALSEGERYRDHLAELAAAGKSPDEAVFELCRATGEKTCFLKITVKNAFISSITMSGGGDIPSESLSIAYTDIEWEYKQLNPDDFKEKTTIGHKWSLKTNTGE